MLGGKCCDIWLPIGRCLWCESDERENENHFFWREISLICAWLRLTYIARKFFIVHPINCFVSTREKEVNWALMNVPILYSPVNLEVSTYFYNVSVDWTVFSSLNSPWLNRPITLLDRILSPEPRFYDAVPLEGPPANSLTNAPGKPDTRCKSGISWKERRSWTEILDHFTAFLGY